MLRVCIDTMARVWARTVPLLAVLPLLAPINSAAPLGRLQEDAAAVGSPRAAVRGYLEACREADFARAAEYLDLRSLPPGERAEEGADLARHLKVVLDQVLWIDLEALSDDPAGDLQDGLHQDLERVGTIETRSGELDVLLRRLESEPEAVWCFAASTVARIPALHDEYGFGILGEILPERFFVLRFLEVQLWQWIGLLVLVVAAYFLSWLATWTVYSLVGSLVARTRTTIDDRVLSLTVKPMRFIVALAFFALGILLLRLAAPVQAFILGLEKGLAVLAVAWLLMRGVDLLSGLLRARLERESKRSAVAVLPLGEKAVKFAVLALALVALLQNLGFNVTGVLAGLGVGGLAVALAAQKSIENLFGGLSLIMDQPVRVGDFCRYGDKIGTVEDIGLRTTKIRTLDRTVVSVPNAEFAQMQLENFARRDKILFRTKLGLRYETTPDQLRWVLAEIRRLLLAHPKVDPSPGRIRFTGYGDYSLDLEIFAFVYTADINEYLGIQEDLLLRIMDIVNASGTGFAFPSSTTYLARDGGNDEERTKEAEARVREWRERGELPFPDFAAAVKSEIDDSVDYPPRGSAVVLPQS